jgi:hypothetical protein
MVTSAKRLRDCRKVELRHAGREAYVRTEFEPPADIDALDTTVESLLAGALHLDASGTELRRALTLRGGFTSSALLKGLAIGRAGCAVRIKTRSQPLAPRSHPLQSSCGSDTNDRPSGGSDASGLRRWLSQLRLPSVDKTKLSSMGANAFFSYGLVSSWSSALLTSLAWFTFSRLKGVSPLYPQQWKPFLAIYAGLYLSVSFALRPIRFVLAISLTPRFEAALLQIQKIMPCRKTNKALNRALSLVVMIIVGNILTSFAIAAGGICLSSLISGVNVFPPATK